MTPTSPLTETQLLDYMHGRLDPEARQRIEQLLAADPEARQTLAEWHRQDAAIQALYAPVAQEPVPERLSAVIRRARAQDAARSSLSGARQLAAALTLVGFGLAGGWLARDFVAKPVAPQRLPMAAIEAHDTFVVEVAHPVEVAASDAAHLQTWMSKRLGHDIRPPDFETHGFTLLGGRIVPIAEGAAALFMYENTQGQRVTLYVAPQDDAAQTGFRFAEKGRTQSFYWMDRDLSYAIAGEVPRDVLRRIALAAYDQLI